MGVNGQPARVLKTDPHVGAGGYGEGDYLEGRQAATVSDPGGLGVELPDPVGDEEVVVGVLGKPWWPSPQDPEGSTRK